MTSEARRQRNFLRGLFVVAALLVAVVVRPFAGAFFSAAVLAAVLFPLQDRLAGALRGRRHAAAAIVTAAGVVALAAPLALVASLLARQAEAALEWTSSTLAREGTAGLVEPLPDPLEKVALRALQALPAELIDVAAAESGALAEGIETESSREREVRAAERGGDVEPEPEPEVGSESEPESAPDQEAETDSDSDLDGAADSPDAAAAAGGGAGGGAPPFAESESITPAIGASVAAARDLLSALGDLVVDLGVLLVATFFLLSEGHRLIAYLIDLAPIDGVRARGMLSAFRDVVVGVFLSTILTALAQTAVAAVAFLIAGVPGLTMILLAVFVASFVPAVGGGGATMLVGVYLMLAGRIGMGIFVFAWGIAAVGMVDNFVKPWVARDRAQMPTAVVFFAMICGLAAFGAMGLVAGPLIVAFFQITARMLREEDPPVGPRAPQEPSRPVRAAR